MSSKKNKINTIKISLEIDVKCVIDVVPEELTWHPGQTTSIFSNHFLSFFNHFLMFFQVGFL